jgi:inorganic pyrophosphatase
MHPWHDVRTDEPDGATFPVVIETPAGSRVQYEIDRTTGLVRVKRVLYSAIHYPANYGFIPRTLDADGTGLDVLVLGQEPLQPGCIVRARAIGLLRMREKEPDDKVIAVLVDDPSFAPYRSLEEIPAHWKKLVHRFFEDYRALEGPRPFVGAYESSEEAYRLIRRSREHYEARFA